jgi:hypothetical protein
MKTNAQIAVDTINSILFSFDENSHFVNGNDGMEALNNMLCLSN